MNKIKNPVSALFKYLSISLLFTAIGSILSINLFSISTMVMLSTITQIGIVVLLLISLFSKKVRLKGNMSMNFVMLIALLMGIGLAPTFFVYFLDLGATTFISVIIGAFISFAVLAKISANNPSDKFLSMGQILTMILIGLLVVGIVNLFIKSETISFVSSCVGFVLFSLYVLYDISLFKRELEYGRINERDDLSAHVLNLYIDVINMITDLLRIVAKLKD
jgi:FtsH-binding integral membrane protein